MQIHPMVVHFPIALLTIYAIMELIWYKHFAKLPTVVNIKVFLVLLGVIGAVGAILSGDIAENTYKGSDLTTLIEIHSSFAISTTICFIILAIANCAYIVEALAKQNSSIAVIKLLDTGLKHYRRYVLYSPVKYVVSLICLLGIVVTGALGGAIVYGKDVDPVVSMIVSIIGHFVRL